MARMIDGDKLVENLRLIATCWSISPFVSKEKHNGAVDMLREVEREVKEAPTLTPPNEALTLEQLREMKDKPAYLNVFNPLLESGWHIIKAVTEDKIIFRGWQTVYVPIDGMGIDYNLYRRPPEGTGQADVKEPG